MRRRLSTLSIPFREPYTTAAGTVRTRELLLLRLEDEDGATGFGEAAPFEPYDGVSIDRVAAALRGQLAGPAPPQARAADELARLDLEARRAGRPLADVPAAAVVEVNLTLPAAPPAAAAARAAEGGRAGYRCFKLKVGLADDGERIAAVRAALGPDCLLRLDANGAWGATEAIERVRALEPYGLELVEQPCRTLAELAAVRRAVGVPIAADESVATARDVHAAADAEACDAVCVKLAGSGGFAAAREALRVAAERGLDAYLSSTLDGPWGIAAALQLAAAEGVSRPCGLATLDLFHARIARALPAPEGGAMAVPAGPGLGVEVSAEALAEVTVEELE